MNKKTLLNFLVLLLCMVGGHACEDKSDATPFLFLGSETSWTIQFESGNYLSLKNSKDNGKVQVVANASTFTASNLRGQNEMWKRWLSLLSLTTQLAFAYPEPLVGFEPTTPRLQITCSGQLS